MESGVGDGKKNDFRNPSSGSELQVKDTFANEPFT
jgi:hypothetical protein